MELVKNGVVATLMATGAIVKTAFCGPCFGAGDTPSNNESDLIRHSTRNFPNREGSKVQKRTDCVCGVMDARSIAATAANKGYLTPATASGHGVYKGKNTSLTKRFMPIVFLTVRVTPTVGGDKNFAKYQGLRRR